MPLKSLHEKIFKQTLLYLSKVCIVILLVVMCVTLVLSFGGFFNVAFTPNDFLNKHAVGLVISLFTLGYFMGGMRRT